MAKESFDLGKPFEIVGKWRILTNPSDWHVGKLTYSKEGGLALEIHDSFVHNTNGPLDFVKYDIVQGITTEVTPITLVNCSGFPSLLNSLPNELFLDRYITETYSVRLALIGSHFNSIDDITVKKAEIEFPSLSNWIGGRAINVDFTQRPSGMGLERMDVTFNESEIAQATVNEFTLTLNKGAHSTWDMRTLFVNEKPYLSIVLSEEILLSEFEKFVKTFQDFLTLASNIPQYPSRAILHSSKAEDENKDIYQIYKQPLLAERKFSIDIPEMLLSLRACGGNFNEIFNKWYTLNNELTTFLESYFVSVYNYASYPDHRFLSLIEGLESYHRSKFDSQAESEQAFRQKKNRIKRALLDGSDYGMSDWEWVARNLYHANEVSFSTRMREIFLRYGEYVSCIDSGKLISLVDEIAETRNAMMHPEEGREKPLTGWKLILVNYILKQTIEAIILVEIGVPVERVKGGLSHTPDCQRAKQLSQSLHL